MKTLFFGTSAFAVPSLEAAARRTELQGVVTQPDRPAGRGQKLTAPPVKTAAQQLGVPVYQPASLRDFPAGLLGQHFDFFILASYGKLIPQSLLDVPELGSLNVHPSLLPQYRGATPIQSALRDGASETGVTIMLMDAGLDTGDVVLQERTPILPGETFGELHDRLARFGAQALIFGVFLEGQRELKSRIFQHVGDVVVSSFTFFAVFRYQSAAQLIDFGGSVLLRADLTSRLQN